MHVKEGKIVDAKETMLSLKNLNKLIGKFKKGEISHHEFCQKATTEIYRINAYFEAQRLFKRR